jgi:lipoprotein-anchoring transpeptidase ErfK/SrfK
MNNVRSLMLRCCNILSGCRFWLISVDDRPMKFANAPRGRLARRRNQPPFCRNWLTKKREGGSKNKMMRRLAPFLLILAAVLASGPRAASAQSYRDSRDPYVVDSWSEDDDGEAIPYESFDRPTRAYPRRDFPLERPGRGVDPSYGEIESAPRGGPRQPRVAALPRDADPAYSTPLDFDDLVDPGQSTREPVRDPTGAPPGAITIDTRARKLYLSLGGGQAIQYGVGVGREGFSWKGKAQIGRKAFWPGWTPPKEMLLRRPDLPLHMEGGLENPLGARALYLFAGAKDTMFRIHGTSEPDTIGQAVSSGCIRMLNADVIDLYGRVAKGTQVVVR